MTLSKIAASILVITLLASCNPIKLIIKNDGDKEVLKLNMPIVITEPGEAVLEMDCKSLCHGCDTTFMNASWMIDSLRTPSMVIRRDLAFKFDTITNQEFKNRSKYDRKKNFEKVIAINKKAHYIYKMPTETIRKELFYNEMGTITFTYRTKCYKGLFERMFANPNKFRQISLKGAETKLKQ